MKKIALILAGGVGKRSKETIPKQFIKVKNKPLIIYTLEQFEENKNVDYISIVCHKDWIDFLKGEIKKYNITKVNNIIEGGKNGLESAYNGIKEINKSFSPDTLVLIHDAVRPFIDQISIDNNIEIAKKYGLAMCAIPLVETLANSNDGEYAQNMIPRDKLYRILTPQTFKLSILNKLYDGVDIIKSNEPSTFSLYMSKGYPIYLSKGSEKNIKITYPEDISYFKNFF